MAISVITLDQLTKSMALQFLELYEPVPVIPEVLNFTLAFNDRAAFSLGGANTWVFTLLASLACLFLLWVGPKFRTRGWLLLPNGHVVDFIQIPFNFPIFNIADMAISSAAFLIALRMVRGDKFGGSK